MNVLVCIKRTPATEARIRIGDGGTTIEPSGVKYIVSPYDEFALEAALRTRDSAGDGEVTVLTSGPALAAEQLRSCLAMGADRAVLLRADPGMDGLATAKKLVSALAAREAPLTLFGVKAVDHDQQQVGPMVATLLGRPCVTAVSDFQVEDGVAICRREVEGGVEVVEVDLPAVLTITKGVFEPRYASLKGIMAAKKRPLEEVDAEGVADRIVVDRLEEPAPRPPGRLVGEGPDSAKELVRLLRAEAKVL